MKHNKILVILLFMLTFLPFSLLSQGASSRQQINAVEGLIERLLPGKSSNFKVEMLKSEEHDRFELESVNGKIILRGTNGVAVASALKYYLEQYAHCQITWHSTNLNLPQTLPQVKGVVSKKTPYNYRYYLNYCTFNYSMSWWDWERWEKEIDWMALHGINLPLAITGQAYVWNEVYKQMGFTYKDLMSFYAGPAYLNWFWMGNLDGWNGPLSEAWMKKDSELQKKILERERSFGMTPILPAFTGHVPPAFKDKFPEAKINQIKWVDFPPVNILDPNDPLFIEVGKRFISELIKTYGTDHFYTADTFNEMKPPSNDSTYLDKVSKNIYKAMAAVDNQAKWVMQGWIFVYSGSAFWGETQTKALLNAVPDDKMLILDLWGDHKPAWAKKNAFYGKNWIWCMLHNFGGNNLLHGRMETVASDPANVLNSPNSGNMAGIGLTMEAIEQNPVIYSLMLENVWNDQPIDLDKWLKSYILNRYGKNNPNAEKAWNVLRNTVYSNEKDYSARSASIIAGRPTLKKNANWTYTYKKYNTKDLIPALDYLIMAADDLKGSDGFRYDLADVTRQVLANYADTLQRNFSKDYAELNYKGFKDKTNRFLEIISDMDDLSGTRKEWMLGNWVNDAKKCAATEEEVPQFIKNAKNLLTTWGNENSDILDYSWRLWSGMLDDYYRPRWELFFKVIDESWKENNIPSIRGVEQQLKDWEWKWINSPKLYPTEPKGDEIEIATRLYKKYIVEIKATFQD